MSYKPYYLYLFAGICLCLCALLTSVNIQFSLQNDLQMLQKANQLYDKGEKETSIAGKEAAFNSAVELYNQLIPTVRTSEGKAKLFYNLANSYYQLQSYPWAVLFYYKSLYFSPNDLNTQDNLALTLKTLGIETGNETASKQTYGTNIHYTVIFALQLLLALTVVIFIFGSLFIWMPRKWLKLPLVLLISTWVLLSGYNIYIRYVAPLEGVLVQATMLYKTPNESVSQIADDPLLSGSKIRILEYAADSNWTQIILPDGRIGFVQKKDMRLI